MTKRNLFTTLAAIFVSAAFFAGCDHALSQQTASVSFSIPADVLKKMLQNTQPASEQEIAKMALASRQAADAADAYATLTVSLSRHAAPQTRFFTEEEFLEVEGGDKEIPPFIFTGLPVGAHVTVTASLLLANGTYYEDNEEALLAVGPNSVSLMLRRMSLPQLAGTFTRTPDSDQIKTGEQVTFSYSDQSARLSLKVEKTGGTLQAGDIMVASGGTHSNGLVEVTGSTATLAFNTAGIYTVTPTASKDGYNPQTGAAYSIAVETPALGGTITASPSSGATLTRGDSVTFSYTDGSGQSVKSKSIIHLTLSDAAGVSVVGGNLSGTTVTGVAGQDVVLTFNPTSSDANPANKTYTVSNVYASMSDGSYNQTTSSAQYSYTVQFPQLTEPTLTVTDATTGTGGKYYTSGGAMTVKASNTNGLPAGTKLYYTIDGGNQNSVEPATGFTLDIRGNAYNVEYWYGTSNYRESAKKTSAYTVWLASSQIKVTATSRQSSTSGNAEARGSSPSLAHQFYGVTGSTFTFSIADAPSGISVNQSAAINLEHNGNQTVRVQAMKGGAAVSETVTFNLSATMRPITFELSNLVLWVGFDDKDYGTIGDAADIFGEVKIQWPDSSSQQELWSYSHSGGDWSPGKGNHPLDRKGQTTYTATAPSQEFWLYAYIGEEDVTKNNTVMNKNMTRTVTAIYTTPAQVITSDKNDCSVTFTFTVNQ